MRNEQLQGTQVTEEGSLKFRLQEVLHSENLHTKRGLLTELAAELAVDVLDCGAALLYVLEQDTRARVSSQAAITPPPVAVRVENADVPATTSLLAPLKMVRYRLDVGKKHQLNVAELKKLLVEESGVDKNNINNVMIHGQYTLIELPDEMPQDIFQHLKMVEINNHKLNIKRLKTRTKKQAHNRFRRGKQRTNPRNDDTLD
jgi:DbpA RNA binding domain